MTLKQQNKHLSDELQKVKDSNVNLQRELKQEQSKRFVLIKNQTTYNESLKELETLKNKVTLNASSELTEAENKISILQNATIQKDKDIKILTDEVTLKAQTVKKLQTDIEQKDKVTITLDLKFKQKIQHVAIIEHSLSIANLEVKKDKDTISILQKEDKDKKQTIKDLESSLSKNNKSVKFLKDELTLKVQIIQNIQADIKQKDKVDKGLENKINALQEELSKEKDLHALTRNRFKSAEVYIEKLKKVKPKFIPIQEAKDKVVNLQENLKQEQLKSFELQTTLTEMLNKNMQLRNELSQASIIKSTPNDNRVRRNEGVKKWQQ